MTARPPWYARNKQERLAMMHWAHAKLDDLQADEVNALGGVAFKRASGLEREIAAADHGDIAPLRKRYPEFARFLVAPSPRKRKKRQRVVIDPVAAAVWAVGAIRKIWKQEYGLKNRRKGEGPSAIEIAAAWADVDIAAINRALKPSGPSGIKKKNF